MSGKKRKSLKWFRPWWFGLAERRKALAAQVRARDGDNCWRCGYPMVFGGQHPGKGRHATIEHFRPLSKGGTWALDNLRLCHPGCNRHLGDKDPEQKERMRLPGARGVPG